MLTGYQLAYNSFENIACYGAGLASTLGLELTVIPCGEGSTYLGEYWAIPCSTNGTSVTGFNYVKATNATKPRADAVKTILVQNNLAGGTYGRWVVTDAFDTAAWATLNCAGALPAVTIPAPIIANGQPTFAAAVTPAVVNRGTFFIPAYTGSNDTNTATGYAFDANGVAIALSPATSVGTTPTLLAAAMTTNWATEFGSGTFVANGQEINWTGTAAASAGVTLAQSDAP